MATITRLAVDAGRIGLVLGFAGLGALGVALLGMAVVFPAGAVERLVVLVMGAFGILIAVGAFLALRNRPRGSPP